MALHGGVKPHAYHHKCTIFAAKNSHSKETLGTIWLYTLGKKPYRCFICSEDTPKETHDYTYWREAV